MKRLDRWPEAMNAAIDAARTKPFDWGAHDCCLFCADVIHAMTGEDPAAPWRGTYNDAAGAARLLASLGGVEGLATKMLGAPRPTPLLAQRGDVATFVGEDGEPALGVVVGRDVAYVTAEGLRFVRITETLKAWRV